jgi:8-oxo-dGTP diphosphatase
MFVWRPLFSLSCSSIRLQDERPSHFITIFMRGEEAEENQVPVNLEEDKCEGWQWIDWGCIPQPIFHPLSLLLESGYFPNLQGDNKATIP